MGTITVEADIRLGEIVADMAAALVGQPVESGVNASSDGNPLGYRLTGVVCRVRLHPASGRPAGKANGTEMEPFRPSPT